MQKWRLLFLFHFFFIIHSTRTDAHSLVFDTLPVQSQSGNTLIWDHYDGRSENIFIARFPDWNFHQITDFISPKIHIRALSIDKVGHLAAFALTTSTSSQEIIVLNLITLKLVTIAHFSCRKELCVRVELSADGEKLAWIDGQTLFLKSLNKSNSTISILSNVHQFYWEKDASCILVSFHQDDDDYIQKICGEKFITHASYHFRGVIFEKFVVSSHEDKIAAIVRPTYPIWKNRHIESPTQSCFWQILQVDLKTGRNHRLWKSLKGKYCGYLGKRSENLLLWNIDTLFFSFRSKKGISICSKNSYSKEICREFSSLEPVHFFSDKNKNVYVLSNSLMTHRYTINIISKNLTIKSLFFNSKYSIHALFFVSKGIFSLTSSAKIPPTIRFSKSIADLSSNFWPSGVITSQWIMMHNRHCAQTPAIVFLPSKNIHKLVIYIHGGPEEPVFQHYNTTRYYLNTYFINQSLVSLGFVVIAINYGGTDLLGMHLRQEDPTSPFAIRCLDLELHNTVLDRFPGFSPMIWGTSFGAGIVVQLLSIDPSFVSRAMLVHPYLEKLNLKQIMETWKVPTQVIQGSLDANVSLSQIYYFLKHNNRYNVGPIILKGETHYFSQEAWHIVHIAIEHLFLQNISTRKTH